MERIAVLRFENLGADFASDWMGRGFSEIAGAELDGIPGLYSLPGVRIHAVSEGLGSRPADAPGISAERMAAIAAGATELVYGQYEVHGGTLDAQVTVEDLLTGRMTVLTPVSAPAAEMVAAASAVARQISPRASPYGTQNASVVAAYVEALEHLDHPDVAGNLQKANAADPNFGPIYRQLAHLRVREQDTDGAGAILDQALARGNAIPETERARIQLELADLHNDPAARLAAMTAVAKAELYDPQIWQDLGAAAMVSHRYPQAAEAYRKASDIQPDNADLWNQLGYASAYAGDAGAASTALNRYRALAPDSPNPVDSLGDLDLMEGRLPDAEKLYLENARKNPQFYAGLEFLKAALAHSMTGDVAGADAIAQQYFAATGAKEPALDYRKAQWAWMSGRHKAALEQMEEVAARGGGNIAANAYSEMAIWLLLTGNREAAAAMALKASAVETRSSVLQATLARFLTQAPASAEVWQARAGTLVRERPQAPIGKVALADALLLSKEYAAALPVLQAMYDGGNPSAGEGLPVLLAWADVETGHIPEAAALLRLNPPLADSGLSWSTPLYFPRIFYLRSVVAEKQGKADEARENMRVFKALSGRL